MFVCLQMLCKLLDSCPNSCNSYDIDSYESYKINSYKNYKKKAEIILRRLF